MQLPRWRGATEMGQFQGEKGRWHWQITCLGQVCDAPEPSNQESFLIHLVFPKEACCLGFLLGRA